jgi:two-component system, response regulator, stage 0 sporulation protein A
VEKPIRLLIVDDDCVMCDRLRYYLDGMNDIEVVGIANNGIDGLELLRKHNPTIVLLDIIMPQIDGLGFLERANTEKLLNNVKVIVTSELSQESIVKYAFYLGASFYMLKPYSFEYLLHRIHNISFNTENIEHSEGIEGITMTKSSDLNSIVSKLLLDSGLPSHTLGYKYFSLAVNHLLKEKTTVFSITKNIYPLVAKHFDTSSACVDKAMRHSLSLAYNENHTALGRFLQEMNYLDSGKRPSNSEYVNLVLERIRQELITLN